MKHHWYKRLRTWFYRGPVELGITIPRRRGYQSPTITAALWAYALFCRHFTQGGRVLFLCLGFLLPFSLLNLPMPEYMLGFGVAALFLINILLSWPLRPRILFRRELPERVRAGTESRVDYEIRNSSSLPCFDLRLDTLPWPKPFAWTRGTAFLPFLAGRQALRAHSFFQADRRGEFMVPAFRAVSAFPFQLWSWGRTNTDGPQRVLVHPAFVPLTRLAMPPAAQRFSGESGWVSAAGSSHEFVGCREFRDGDLPRHLHWRSWARLGYPVVKEFRDYYQFLGLVVLDVHARRPWHAWLNSAKRPDARFEAAISLAAAVCENLTRVRASIHFVLPRAETFAAAGPSAELAPLLDRMACLQPDRDDHFVRAGECLDTLSPEPAFAWILLLNWNPARKALLASLRQRRIPFKVVFVAAAGSPPPELPACVQVVEAGDIQAGRCRSL